ncbi:MAG: hypothetical protein ACI9DJ_001648 [Algoriphagus sp.]|jgi:hypothetical protein
MVRSNYESRVYQYLYSFFYIIRIYRRCLQVLIRKGFFHTFYEFTIIDESELLIRGDIDDLYFSFKFSTDDEDFLQHFFFIIFQLCSVLNSFKNDGFCHFRNNMQWNLNIHDDIFRSATNEFIQKTCFTRFSHDNKIGSFFK